MQIEIRIEKEATCKENCIDLLDGFMTYFIKVKTEQR